MNISPLRLLNAGALPDESTAIPLGSCNVAKVASPLSPLYPEVSMVPATVVMMPVETVTLRMQWKYGLLMYTLPMKIGNSR